GRCRPAVGRRCRVGGVGGGGAAAGLRLRARGRPRARRPSDHRPPGARGGGAGRARPPHREPSRAEMLTCTATSSMDLVLGTLILRWYVFGFVACFLVAGTVDLGWRRTLVFAAWVWPLVWAAEFASTRVGVPFGFYHYTGATRGRGLYVVDAPLIDSLSFTFLAYAAFSLARGVLGNRAGAWPLAATGGVLMMLLDVVIDPIAVRGDRWFLGRIFYYVEEGAYFGVPLVNFAGWALVGTLAIGGYLVLTRDA